MVKQPQNANFGECPACGETVEARGSSTQLHLHNNPQGVACENVVRGRRQPRYARGGVLRSRPRGDNPPTVSRAASI